MLVRCNKNSGKSFSAKHLSLGYTNESVLHVSIGKDYFVYAMSLWRGILQILLSDDNALPNWYPIECFSIVDQKLPNDWSVAFYGRDHSVDLQAIWGYRDLIHDDQHYDSLLERDKVALTLFAQERARRLNDEVLLGG